jgi:hypothetical protein
MSASDSSPDSNCEAPPNFSVFRALRVERHEIRHSNFFAWLINPRESHLQGTLFLGLFLDAVADAVGDEQSTATKLRAAEATAGNIEVTRESDRLDLRILMPEAKVAIGIENKVFAAEQAGQLTRYADSLLTDFKTWNCVLLYLTVDGDLPSDDRWLSVTHRLVLDVITKGLGHLSSATSPAVRAFIEHYAELLRDIYRNRPAIQRPLIAVQTEEHVQVAIDDAPAKKPEGWENFESLLRILVQVPKAEVVELMAKEKAERIEHRRRKNGD